MEMKCATSVYMSIQTMSTENVPMKGISILEGMFHIISDEYIQS